MRLRAHFAWVAVATTACGPLPKDVKLDLANGSVSAGTCTCSLPVKAEANVQQPR